MGVTPPPIGRLRQYLALTGMFWARPCRRSLFAITSRVILKKRSVRFENGALLRHEVSGTTPVNDAALSGNA